MWLVGSSCLCKLMTSLFSVVSFHWFVLLAHWSPCTPLLDPSSTLLYYGQPRPSASSWLINMRADGVNSEKKKMCFLHQVTTLEKKHNVGVVHPVLTPKYWVSAVRSTVEPNTLSRCNVMEPFIFSRSENMNIQVKVICFYEFNAPVMV